MIELLVCNKNERLWEEYFLLLMNHYEELRLPYDAEMTLSFIGTPILEGNAMIARLKETNETVASLGFVFGTGADGYEDHSICQVEIIYIEHVWRQTKLFVSMLLAFADFLEHKHPSTKVIQFWSPADQDDLNRLFMKFSEPIKTSEKSFGRIHLYQTTPERIVASYFINKERVLSDYEIQFS